MLAWRNAVEVAVAAALVAGCSSAIAPPAGTPLVGTTTAALTATAAPKSARGDEDAIETIPWDEVGPVSCGPGEALIDYDPAASTSTVLLGPRANDGSVTMAVACPGQKRGCSSALLRSSRLT